MDDPLAVRIVQGSGQWGHIPYDLFDLHGLVRQHVLEVTAGYKLADDIGKALVLAEVVYLEDVGVLQPRNGLRFLSEPCGEVGSSVWKEGSTLTATWRSRLGS
jgi:hypothetical protein